MMNEMDEIDDKIHDNEIHDKIVDDKMNEMIKDDQWVDDMPSSSPIIFILFHFNRVVGHNG